MMGAPVEVLGRHDLKRILGEKAAKVLSPSRLTQYEQQLLGRQGLHLKACNTLNPATLLPQPGELIHDCIQTLEYSLKPRIDLTDQPIAGRHLYVDGSSKVIDGQRYAGCAVCEDLRPIKSVKLPPTYSTQMAELAAAIEALKELSQQEGNIYTDSKYVFQTAHAFAMLWKERGFIKSDGHRIEHQQMIKEFLECVQLPKKVAIVHVKAHGKESDSARRKGNHQADEAAKEAALSGQPLEKNLMSIMIPWRELIPQYSKKEEDAAIQYGAQKLSNGWWQLPTGLIFVPKAVLRVLVLETHKQTHLGGNALGDLLIRQVVAPGLYEETKRAVYGCTICAATNPAPKPPPAMGGRPWAYYPFQRLQIDFAELPRCAGYKYLLVIIDQLTGWIEAFPTRAATAITVAKILLKEFFPRYSMPETFESDQGPHFVSKIICAVSVALGFKWNLHTPWRPQSSGQVERANWTVKTLLTKLCQETKLNWITALPLALTIMRNTPRGKTKLTPFESLFGRPPNEPGPQTEINGELGNRQLLEYVTALQGVLSSIHRHNREFQRLPLDVAIHQYQPGDWIRVRKWKQEPLRPTWGSPEQIILITKSAVKLVGHKRWVHASRIKKAEPIITQEPEKGVAKDSPPGEAKDQTPEEKWLSETVPGFNLKLKLKKQRD
ncbi:protein NYNRIN-like isoform X1 [Rhineura floridana]|uniref:protein NYNRIN-like isoform X1 n=1 Tax=Rhineura floridana TaxID=261503 RepID=UPI002AC7F018|nr:protein NYNRIN-like isoform X1 [Rhineura floridana]XP_061493467.1 protein NYNRIN-like isoform X1 [Rhineura floridana]